MRYTNYFADVYGAGTYNSESYSSTGTTTSAGAPDGGGSSGVLANTGFDLILGATIGSVIIFSALVIRIWKRPAKKSVVKSEATSAAE